MSGITTLLYKYLNTAFGKQDWDLGSVLRELVAQPVVGLSETASAAVLDVYNDIDIAALSASPEEHAEAIDNLFRKLELSAPSTKKSSGTVQILTDSYADFLIPTGTTFTHDSVVLVTDASYNATTTPVSATDLQIKQIGINAYVVNVPVVSVADGVSLAANTELEWSSLNTGVYSAKVDSAVTGGIGAYTATEKINLIRQRLFPNTFSCAKSLLRTLNNLYPNTVCDCIFGNKLNAYGAADVYIKTVSAPDKWNIKTQSIGVDVNTRKATINAAGIYKAVSVNGEMLDSTTINNNGSLIDIRYSSADIAADISVLGLSQLPVLQTALDNFTANTGMRFRLLVPRLLELSMLLPVSGGSMTNTTTSAIVAAVNNSTLNNVSIGDNTIKNIIAAQGMSLDGPGTYILKDIATEETLSALSNINVSAFVDSGMPFAIYTAMNLIGVVNG